MNTAWPFGVGLEFLGTRQELRRLKPAYPLRVGDVWSVGLTQPESLILAQSERWRQA